jgi:hypothetical protein
MEVIFFPMAQLPLVGHGLLIIEASWSHAVRHTTLGRAPLDEWSARPDNTQHTWKTSMPPAEFETTNPASERPQIYALDRAATGIGEWNWIR